jgi:hypothetical protein
MTPVVMPAKAGIQHSQSLRIDRTANDYWIIRFRG